MNVSVPAPKHHYHVTHRRMRGARVAARAALPAGSLTPIQVAAGYGVAAGSAKVVRPIKIGVLSLGGSYVASDLQTAASTWGMPMPTVDAITAGGAAQDSSDHDSNVENQLDLQCAAGGWWQATGTAADLVIAFGQNATGGMLAAFNALVAAGCMIITISWGGPDSSWDPSERAGLAAAFADARAKGIWIFAAAGDNSADDGTSTPVADYPCSDLSVWAVGGTNLVLNADGSYASESAWGDGSPGDEGGGGGWDPSVSTPSWQDGVIVAGPQGGRGVPDSAANADPNTGYQEYVNGSWTVVGGTSGASPITAGIAAAALASVTASVATQADIYRARKEAFRDVVTGSNGYPAGAGWDAATGLGSPGGASFIAALSGASSTSSPAPSPTPTAGPDPTPTPSPMPPSPTPAPTPVGCSPTLAQVQAWITADLMRVGLTPTWAKKVAGALCAYLASVWPSSN